ncbi:MAG: hypothetical protein V7K85_04560 [Nostoc sp.]
MNQPPGRGRLLVKTLLSLKVRSHFTKDVTKFSEIIISVGNEG